MEKSVKDNLLRHIQDMRKKVIEQKGVAVEGLSKVFTEEEKNIVPPSKTREANA